MLNILLSATILGIYIPCSYLIKEYLGKDLRNISNLIVLFCIFLIILASESVTLKDINIASLSAILFTLNYTVVESIIKFLKKWVK